MDFVSVDETSPSDSPKGVTVCGDCAVTSSSEKDPDKASLLPPIERIVYPRDITDIGDEDESICIVGTREGKVTRIQGLERNTKLKVNYSAAAINIYDNVMAAAPYRI